MDYRYKQLEQDLSALNSVFSDLGSRLGEAAKDVTTSGVLPSEKLIEQILTARTKFESVRTAIHSQATAMLVSPLPKATDLVSIQGIGGLLKIAANAEESKFSAQGELEQVTNLLSRVLAITHRETAGFQPLVDCHLKVTELRNAISNLAWPNRHPEAEAIIALRHPSTVLLNFVENLDTLEDDKWIALETTITEAYGKPLFVAASRGKLVAQQAAGKAAEPTRTAAPIVERVVEKAVERPIEKKPAPEKLSEKTVVSPAATAHVETKEAPAAPAHVTHAPPAAPMPVAPAAVTQTPVAAPVSAPPSITPITSTTIPPRPPAPVAAPPAAVATPPSAPAPAAATSLSALANATEPVTERKPAATAPSEGTDKKPRLATPAPQPPARSESSEQEQERVGDEDTRAMAGDGQRPQRWGFWRGNR